MIRLTLYSRPECHLCETMLAELKPLLDGRASVEIVDISADESLLARYLLEIPVLAHGAEELSRHPLDRARVETYLAQSGA